MGIFNILFRNSGQKARTLRPEEVSIPAGFRGMLSHDIEQCIGCKTCAYVCSPGAITLDSDADGIYWQYQATRCTFCGGCAEYCPTGAISLEAAPHQSALAESLSLDLSHIVEYKSCARCHKPFNPLPVPVLEKLIGREVTPAGNGGYDIPYLMRLCEKCRARVTSQRLKDSLIGKRKPKGGK